MDNIDVQLNHRTVRKFRDEKVSDEDLKKLFEVANRTATSTGMQQYSIIRITDMKLKEELSVIGNQDYIKDCPELLVFVSDIYRNKKIAEESGYKGNSWKDMDRFFQGFTDACLAAQNMTVAIESLGMGAVYFGSILNDTEKLCEILKLPEYTFPVIGLGFGYPDQEPQLKPRMSMDLKVFENEYRIFPDYLEEIKDYDEEMTHYYDTRNMGRRSDSFSKQVVTRFMDENPLRRAVAKVIKKQGFDL